MILGHFPIFRQRHPITVDDDTLAASDRDFERTRNRVLERGLRHARVRVFSSLLGLVALLIGIRLGWSPSGILLFFLYYTTLTVVIDCMRAKLAWRRVEYGHTRENRVLDVLDLCRSSKGRERFAYTVWRPGVGMLLSASVLCAAVVVPLVTITLPMFEWAKGSSIFANRFMPLLLLIIVAARVAQALIQTLRARAAPTGTEDILLESADSVDIFVGVLALAWTVFVFGGAAPLVIVILILALRLCFRVANWWALRQALPVLSKYDDRVSPDQEEQGDSLSEHGDSSDDWETTPSPPEDSTRV
jgi:hypothetical protein